MVMPIHTLERTISIANSDQQIAKYLISVEEIGNPVSNSKGCRLLQALKREIVKAGPYPNVTLFEAANRIVSDLVILYGVKWLLDKNIFPFTSYTVEYGNEDANGFDIRATSNGKKLIGEAFNVAPSFFQSKKTAVLKKLRKPGLGVDYKIVMFNHDAVEGGYKPKPRDGEYFVIVQVDTGDSYMVPDCK